MLKSIFTSLALAFIVSVSYAQTITTGTITGSPFCAGATVNVPYTLTGIYAPTNTFTAQLSNAAGSFASPVTIGTLSSTTAGTIVGTIPANIPQGAGYLIRVISNLPAVTGSSSAALTVNALAIDAPTTVGTAFCQTQTFSVSYTLTNGCALPAGNVFTAQLSNASGSFASPTAIGTLSSTAAGTINATISQSTPAGSGYRIRVISSTPGAGLISPDNGTNLTIVALAFSTPSFTGTSFCVGQGFTLTYLVPGGCSFPDTPALNVVTAQLSNASGSFASPVTIGTVTANGPNSINVVIPTSTPTGTGYRIRLVSSNPGTGVIGPDNGTNLGIYAPGINAPTFTGTSFCQGQALTVNYVVPGGCPLPDTPSNNVFTAQLSNATGSFASPVTIGSVVANNSGSISTVIPLSTAAGTGYRIRVISSNPGAGLTSPDNGANLTVAALAINAPNVGATTLCQGQSITVTYTLASSCSVPNTPANNIFTAQLSDATGSFASPVNIGNVTSASGGTIPAQIPINTPTGTAYRVRVISSNPGTGLISPQNPSALTINPITLSKPNFGATTFCQTSTFNISYTVGSCPFLTGNVFNAELSDMFGSFASPIVIGSTTATGTGIITVTIPAGTPAGNAYRIRITATNPAITSLDNGANLTINSLGLGVPTFTGTSFCQGNSFTVSYTVLNSCNFPNTPSANSFTAQLSNAAGSFAAPTTIGSVNATGSGNIPVTIPVATPAGAGYRIRVVSSNPGAGIISPDNGTNVSVSASAGNPTVFGNAVWNAYVYNSTNFTNYTGFYTENNVSFNTTTRFAAANAPSTADASSGLAYAGCPTAATPWAISFKRTNFTCGYYQIDMPSHDDNLDIIVDGVTVYSAAYFGGSATNVYSGFLGPASKVELRLVNTGGPGNLTINFTPSVNLITTSPPATICSGASTTLTASSTQPVTFTWTPTASLTPSSGIGASVTAAPTTTTTYTVTGTDATTGCGSSATVLITVSATFTPVLTQTLPTICSGVTTSTLTASGANNGTYSISPSTGITPFGTNGNQWIADPSVTTTYTLQASNGCPPPKNSTPVTVTVQTRPTNPPTTAYGANVWNAYVHNNTSFSDYYGFYTENNLSFNTTTRWNAGVGPQVANASTGSAYTGCSVSGTNYSISYRRTGIPCGYYQIDIPYHDDNVSLYIDGTNVFTHAGCCDAHSNVFTGFIGPTTKVEVTLINGAGPGSLQINFSPSSASPLNVGSGVFICSGTSAHLQAISTLPGATYSWKNSAGNTNLIATPNQAETDAGPLTANETYTVTLTDGGNTGCTKSATVAVTVNPSSTVSVTPTSNSTYCAGTPFTLTASGASTYTWTGGPGLDTYSGFQVIASPTVTTTYTVQGDNNCPPSTFASSTVTVIPPPPVNTFPTNTWNSYGFDSQTLGTNYVGYYTDNGNGVSGYDFDTRTRWASGAAPSTANATNGQAWRGCPMGASNISLSFKRSNFNCGFYSININFHDDNFALLINGTQVAVHNGCCDTHTAIWTGVLTASSTVEFRLIQGGGGSGLAVQFVPSAPTGTTVWIGAVSTDWFNAANWCNTIPTSTTDALIPASGPAFMPAINGAGAVARNITVGPAVPAGTYTSALPAATLTTTGTSNLDVYGNWDNGGTYTANNGTITFRGTNTGNTISNTLPTPFYNVVINKTNGITNAVGLMQITNLLTFTTGVLTNNTAINILNGGSVAGASNASYVDGPITKTGNVAFIFPVGKGGLYRPIGISAPALATDNFTAQYFNTSPLPTYPNAQRAATLDHIGNAEYWYLNRSGGTSNVNVTLSWNTNSGGVGLLPALRVARWDVATNKWADEGNGGTTGTTTSGTITSAAPITTYSTNFPYTLATTSPSNPLPIELTDFTATLTSPAVVQLLWKTRTEINNDHFEVERSSNGTSFTTITTLAGHGSTSEVHSYSVKDLDAPEGRIYYRLRQVDFDGTGTVSEVVSVENPYPRLVSSYPNPAGDEFSIDLNGRTLGEFALIDMLEKEISLPLTITAEKLSVNTSTLTSGVYIARIVLNGRLFQIKIVRK